MNAGPRPVPNTRDSLLDSLTVVSQASAIPSLSWLLWLSEVLLCLLPFSKCQSAGEHVHAETLAHRSSNTGKMHPVCVLTVVFPGPPFVIWQVMYIY